MNTRKADRLWQRFIDLLMWIALIVGMLAIIFGGTELLIYPAKIPFLP